jgi:hypothetical protein
MDCMRDGAGALLVVEHRAKIAPCQTSLQGSEIIRGLVSLRPSASAWLRAGEPETGSLTAAAVVTI